MTCGVSCWRAGIPALVVTHDLAEARALSDRLALLIDGRVVADGPTGDVLAAPPTGPAALLLGWRNMLPIAAITPMGRVASAQRSPVASACASWASATPYQRTRFSRSTRTGSNCAR